MDNKTAIKTDELRDALIIAGIGELESHGLSGFSLRRVAAECGVSCAAPYRHFKSKDDLILAIIMYINHRWTLLFEHICLTFKDDTRRALIEVCVANIRFWIANPNFRSILMLDDKSLDSLQLSEKAKLTEGVRNLAMRYCEENAIECDDRDRTIFSLLSFIYGSVRMIGSGEMASTAKEINMIKDCIGRVISV